MYREMIMLEMKRPVPDPAGKSIKKGIRWPRDRESLRPNGLLFIVSARDTLTSAVNHRGPVLDNEFPQSRNMLDSEQGFSAAQHTQRVLADSKEKHCRLETRTDDRRV